MFDAVLCFVFGLALCVVTFGIGVGLHFLLFGSAW